MAYHCIHTLVNDVTEQLHAIGLLARRAVFLRLLCTAANCELVDSGAKGVLRLGANVFEPKRQE